MRAVPRQVELRDVGYAVHGDEGAGTRWLVRGLDLTLAAGSQWALTGPSGSGKSSLLNLIGGLIVPAEGELRWGDEPISRRTTAQREAWRRQQVGLVFQQFHLFAELSALQNVLLPWTFDAWRVPGDGQGHAERLLERLGIPAGARCGRLSRGEQQRVAVARALVRRPALVLADEPTASLDPGHAAQACALLQQLCTDSGATLVLATHDPAIAARFGDRLDLDAGKVRSA